MADESDIVVRRSSAVWREVEGETILLDLASSTYLGINAAGSVLWEAIVAGSTVPQLVEVLRARFDVAEDRAREDVDTFLQLCRERGLVD